METRLSYNRVINCIHEWPAGILYGADGATTDECKEILSVLDEVEELDEVGSHSNLLNDVRTKTQQYIERLDNK